MAGLLLSPIISRRVPAKILVVVGLAMYAGTAAIGCFARPLIILLILRGLQGISAGLVLPQQATYAATYPEEERAAIMGLSTGISAFFGVVMITKRYAMSALFVLNGVACITLWLAPTLGPVVIGYIFMGMTKNGRQIAIIK